MDKEQFAESIKDCREKINSGKYDKCACPELKCEWHGKCRECVMLHRAYQDHVPNCLKPIFRNKIKDLAEAIEFEITPKKRTPDEYWDYVEKNYPSEESDK